MRSVTILVEMHSGDCYGGSNEGDGVTLLVWGAICNDVARFSWSKVSKAQS